MRALGHTRSTRSHGCGAALVAALAVVIALVALGPSMPAPSVTRHRFDALRPVASHRAPALDGTHMLGVYDEIDLRARELPQDERARVARTILEEAARAELAPELVLAVIHVESRFRHRAASPAGALGMMQLRPSTMHEELARARVRGADPLDPVANVRAGVRYLGRLVRSFGDMELALVAYNAGPGRLRRHLACGHVPERLLRYAQLVRRHAGGRVSASPSTPALAERLALMPAHAPGASHAYPANTAAGILEPLARAAGVRTASAASRADVRLLDVAPGAVPPLRRRPHDPDPPRDALVPKASRPRPQARRWPGQRGAELREPQEGSHRRRSPSS